MRLTKKPITPKYSYNIELTESEALVLRVVLDSVGGSPDGPRSALRSLTTELGAEFGSRAHYDYWNSTGTIMLPNEWPEGEQPWSK